MLRILLLAALGANPGTWGEAQVSGAGSYGSGTSSLTTYTGLGSASISAFVHHRLRDDDAPLSLQPYLQRTGAVSASPVHRAGPTVNTHRETLTLAFRLG